LLPSSDLNDKMIPGNENTIPGNAKIVPGNDYTFPNSSIYTELGYSDVILGKEVEFLSSCRQVRRILE
jgi:hypothetical protein